MGKLTVKINEKSITINFNKGDTIYDVLAANQIHITTHAAVRAPAANVL